MTVIYGVAGVIISTIFILNCYEKVTGIRFSKIQKVILSILDVFFVYLIAIFIPSFLVVVAATGFITGLIFLIKKSINLAAIVLTIIINQIAWIFIVAFVNFVILDFLNINVYLVAYSSALMLEAGIYTLILRSKLLENVKLITNVNGFKNLTLTLGVFLLVIITFLRALFGGLDYLFHPIIFYLLLSVMVFIAIILTISLNNEVKKYREKVKLETTAQQHLQKIDDLTSLTHSYKNGVRLTRFLLHELTLHLNNKDKTKSVENLLEYSDLVKKFEELATSLGEQAANEELTKYVALLDFPDEWWFLKLTLASSMLQAHEKGILLEVNHELDAWGLCTLSPLDFSDLIGNLVSNALKELDQTNIVGKQIVVRFYKNEAGIFAFEVMDNAHEFSIDILQKLGRRKNSTNGTGDGYAEIFDVLDKVKASFMIEEVFKLGFVHKKIIILLNGRGKIKVKSNYRQMPLASARIDGL